LTRCPRCGATNPDPTQTHWLGLQKCVACGESTGAEARVAKKPTHLVDAIMLLEMFIERNPGTMMPAVLAHVKAAQAEHKKQLEIAETTISTLSAQLDDALSEDAEVVFELDTDPDNEPN